MTVFGRRFGVGGLVVLLLAACQAGPAETARRQTQIAVSACGSEYPLRAGSVRARQACQLQAFENTPYAPPAETALVAQSVVWGDQVDHGTMTVDQFVATMTRAISDLSAEENQQRQQAEQERAAKLDAAAEVMGAFSVYEAEQGKAYPAR